MDTNLSTYSLHAPNDLSSKYKRESRGEGCRSWWNALPPRCTEGCFRKSLPRGDARTQRYAAARLPIWSGSGGGAPRFRSQRKHLFSRLHSRVQSEDAWRRDPWVPVGYCQLFWSRLKHYMALKHEASPAMKLLLSVCLTNWHWSINFHCRFVT